MPAITLNLTIISDHLVLKKHRTKSYCGIQEVIAGENNLNALVMNPLDILLDKIGWKYNLNI